MTFSIILEIVLGKIELEIVLHSHLKQKCRMFHNIENTAT